MGIFSNIVLESDFSILERGTICCRMTHFISRVLYPACLYLDGQQQDKIIQFKNLLYKTKAHKQAVKGQLTSPNTFKRNHFFFLQKKVSMIRIDHKSVMKIFQKVAAHVDRTFCLIDNDPVNPVTDSLDV